MKNRLTTAHMASNSKKMKLVASITVAILLSSICIYFVYEQIQHFFTEAKKKEQDIYHNSLLTSHIFDLPGMIITCRHNNNDENVYTILRVYISLELFSTQDHEYIKSLFPQIAHALNHYLKELSLTDLSKKHIPQELREELKNEINIILNPISIKNVLFKEIIRM